MHKIQQELMAIARSEDINKYSLSELAGKVGARSPQIVKYHLDRLRAQGRLFDEGVSSYGTTGLELVSIPIVGAANCGPADIFAEERIEGYLKISSKLLQTARRADLYALKAKGSSMNRAKVKGEPINSGDYVIVDSRQVQPSEGDYVVAVVDGLANIKRFHADLLNNQVALISESSEDFAPIFLHAEDQADALIAGRVVQVIQNPKIA